MYHYLVVIISDETSAQLEAHAGKQEENHQHVVEDLAAIQNKAKQVIDKIGKEGYYYFFLAG